VALAGQSVPGEKRRSRMRISTAFPSEYLRAADLQGRRVTVKISRVEMRDVGEDTKPVLYFGEKEKGLVLNKRKANTIAAAYGEETDDWVGAEIVLYEMMVEFQGQRKPGIRCLVPPRRPQKPGDEEINDDIPF
jgi:hypothetical protein